MRLSNAVGIVKLTPRKDHLNTPPMDLEGTTPPVPSSSPGIDCMDISPLPHKQPYFVAQVTLPSPSPVETPDEQSMSEDLLSPPEEFPSAATQPVQAPAFLQPPEYVTPHFVCC
jgi:M-phase inducer tyrosine phosphatase